MIVGRCSRWIIDLYRHGGQWIDGQRRSMRTIALFTTLSLFIILCVLVSDHGTQWHADFPCALQSQHLADDRLTIETDDWRLLCVSKSVKLREWEIDKKQRILCEETSGPLTLNKTKGNKITRQQDPIKGFESHLSEQPGRLSPGRGGVHLHRLRLPACQQNNQGVGHDSELICHLGKGACTLQKDNRRK